MQAGAFNHAPHFDATEPAEPAVPAPDEPADAVVISGGCGLTGRQQRLKVPDLLFASTIIQCTIFLAECVVTVQFLIKQMSGCSLSQGGTCQCVVKELPVYASLPSKASISGQKHVRHFSQ